MESIKNFKTKSQLIFFKALEKIKSLSDNERKEYYSYVRSLPSLIVFNGLINTLLYYKSKREKVYEHISLIFEDIFQNYKKFKNNNSNKDLIDYISTLDFNSLRLVTNDIFLISLYLKRVAESELKN
ncbi:MAG: type III-B CRISPR module-associated protein Cmr5 [bacterium]|jgi:CRISPR type III-B/RAMP module-associated protein Cmr5